MKFQNLLKTSKLKSLYSYPHHATSQGLSEYGTANKKMIRASREPCIDTNGYLIKVVVTEYKGHIEDGPPIGVIGASIVLPYIQLMTLPLNVVTNHVTSDLLRKLIGAGLVLSQEEENHVYGHLHSVLDGLCPF